MYRLGHLRKQIAPAVDAIDDCVDNCIVIKFLFTPYILHVLGPTLVLYLVIQHFLLPECY